MSGTYNTTTLLCTNTNQCSSGTYYSGTATCDTCPATAAGYATGTYSNGTCINSCPTGQANGTNANCYPVGDIYGSGYYCPSGSAAPANNSGTYVCYPTGLSYSAGNYCPSGWTISGTSCYPTGDSHATTYYCPSGQTISGTSCYPTGDSNSGTNYCPSGQTITGTHCYPTGYSHSGTNYCPSGQTISGSSCYPTGDVYSSPNYCPSGDVVLSGHCCPSGDTYNSVSGLCSNGNPATVAGTATAATPMPTATGMGAATAMSAATPATAATAAAASQTVATPNQSATLITSPVQSAPATLAPSTGNVDMEYATKNTCATGILYNYSTPNAPTSAGPAVLSSVNPANTANILDYAPIPNAYKELTSFQIANESAMTRGAATPIFYNLKITQDGLLSFAYSVSGGAYSYVIRNQSITASNGPLPSSFRVGFAGSDGGASNIHEILCFKAASANQSGSSATVNEKEAAKRRGGHSGLFRLL